MKLKKDYYVPGVSHVCMFCEQPIGVIADGRIKPLGNKAHILFEKEKPGLYIINCCGDCAKTTDFTKQKNLDDIHDNIRECIELIDKSNGLSNQEIARKRAAFNSDKPKVGFLRIEAKPQERRAFIQEYKEKVEKHAR